MDRHEGGVRVQSTRLLKHNGCNVAMSILPAKGLLVVSEGLHVIRSTAIVVKGVEVQGDMGIVLQVREGDRDEALQTRHGTRLLPGGDEFGDERRGEKKESRVDLSKVKVKGLVSREWTQTPTSSKITVQDRVRHHSFHSLSTRRSTSPLSSRHAH